MRNVISDLRYTVRLLLKSPGFTTTAVLILGFGIGVNTAIFSLINAVILKPLPYSNPDRLVCVLEPQDGRPMGFDYPGFVDTAATQSSFESLAVAYRDNIDLSGTGQPEHLEVDFVSPSLFKVSGLSTVGRCWSVHSSAPRTTGSYARVSRFPGTGSFVSCSSSGAVGFGYKLRCRATAQKTFTLAKCCKAASK